MAPFLAIIMAVFLSGAVWAQEAPQQTAQTPILIVDMKRVLDESKAAVSVQKKIEVHRGEFQKEIADKESEIRTAEQDLLQQRGKIDPKTYAEQENQLRKKFRDVERYVQERRRVLEQATNNSMGRVRSVLQDIIKALAKGHGAHTVLVKQNVLWSEASLDITDQVLERLNAELPDMDVTVEAAADKKTGKTAPKTHEKAQ